jgi:predicted RNase H-like HicB family nuclease
MNGYAVIIEGEGDSYSAYVPDLPGCVAAGSNVAEVEAMIRDAIRLHVESLRAYGEPVPKPTAPGTTIVEVPSAS